MYGKVVWREIEDLHGVVITGRSENNIRCVDDTFLIAEKEEDLQFLQNIPDKAIEERESFGLSCN